MASLKSSILFLVLIGAAAVRADYAPLAVGNVWTFSGTTLSPPSWDGIALVKFRESLSLRVESKSEQDGMVLWTVQIRDSLSEFFLFPDYRLNASDSISRADTVLQSKWILADSDGAIEKVSGDLAIPLANPSLKNRFALSRNHFFLSHARPQANAPLLSGLNSGFTAYHLQGMRTEILDGKMEGWFLDGVGPYWLRQSGGSGCDGSFYRELQLETFNGEKVDIGITPPPMPLAKITKIACAIRKRSGNFRGTVGIQNSSRTVFDFLGRARLEIPAIQLLSDEEVEK